MKKIHEVADLFRKKLAALSPAVIMAVAFGDTMGPLLNMSKEDLTNMVLPALQKAVSQDLKKYSLSEQYKVAEEFKGAIKEGAKMYANSEMENRKNHNYDEEESLSWIAQEVFSKSVGRYDNRKRYGDEGRMV